MSRASNCRATSTQSRLRGVARPHQIAWIFEILWVFLLRLASKGTAILLLQHRLLMLLLLLLLQPWFAFAVAFAELCSALKSNLHAFMAGGPLDRRQHIYQVYFACNSIFTDLAWSKSRSNKKPPRASEGTEFFLNSCTQAEAKVSLVPHESVRRPRSTTRPGIDPLLARSRSPSFCHPLPQQSFANPDHLSQHLAEARKLHESKCDSCIRHLQGVCARLASMY
jgi:hypothetical protein